MRIFGLINLLPLLFFQCELFVSEQMRVVKIIKRGENAIEQEKRSELFAIISKDYLDDWGHNYEKLIESIDNYFQRYEDIKVQITIKKILITKNIAKCYLRVYISSYNIYYDDYTLINQPLIITLKKIISDYLIIQIEKSDYEESKYN